MDNSQNNQPTAPVTQGQPQVQPPAQPVNPVSGPHKEMAPIEAPVAEYVTPAAHEVEPVLPPEVKEAGVESTPNIERPQVTDEHKKVGIELSPETTTVNPAQAQTSNAIQLPYTYAQVQQKLKETPVEDSAHWLAMLHKFILEKLGVRA